MHSLNNIHVHIRVPWKNFPGLDKQNFERKIVNMFLLISFNICSECSKTPSHCDGSIEYPQHMFWLRNKKTIFWYVLLTDSLTKV